MLSNLTCKLCKAKYDRDSRRPHIFPTCGHTFCQLCIKNLTSKTRRPQCPLDKTVFKQYKKLLKLQQFPENLALMNIVDSKEQQCPTHGKEQDLICQDCELYVCSNCVLFGEHQQHKIKNTRAFEGQILRDVKDLGQKLKESSFKETLRDIEKKFAK